MNPQRAGPQAAAPSGTRGTHGTHGTGGKSGTPDAPGTIGPGWLQRLSMRGRLLLGILLPVGLLVLVNAFSLYQQARAAADTAYDRTLLASAKAIGELLDVTGSPEQPRLVANVPYSALEAFEADNRSNMVFRITGFQGEMVSGYAGLPAWHGQLPSRGAYAALVHFYDDVYQGDAVRVAVLLQPVSSQAGLGMATIQVAETLELRQTLARQQLLSTLARQAALLAVIALVVWGVVQHATRPVHALSAMISARRADDLSPIVAPRAPRELQPLLDATNGALARSADLLAHQKRFVRDAAHQLRTPLAVLKTQVQSARRGDVAADQALAEIAGTVDRATELANQMLALAKVEQLRQQGPAPVNDWADAVRQVALDLAPLASAQDIELALALPPQPLQVAGHEWALRELARNLLHNAIRAMPQGGQLWLTLQHGPGDARARLTIADTGPGLSDHARQRLFQPFASPGPGTASRGGSGLGLAICHDIVQALGGALQLVNRPVAGDPSAVGGLDASVWLPVADNGRA